MSDDENDSVHTPTQSEFATFEILANREYTNMSRKKPKRKDLNLRGSFPVDVVEEEQDQDQDEDQDRDRDQQEEEEDLGSEKEKEKEDEEDDEERLNNNKDKDRLNDDKNSNHSKAENENFADSQSVPRSPPESPKKFVEPVKAKVASASFASASSNSKKQYLESVESERRDEKEGLLTELLSLAESGQCKLVRTLTMKDSLEEISFQYDRCQSEIEARRMVNLAKSSIDVGAGLIEMVAKNFGFPLLDGYHKSLCSDMNRFDRPLTKIYKKYWRRGAQKPEMELAMIVIGSFGWTVMSNMMKDGSYLKKIFGGKSASATSASTRAPAHANANGKEEEGAASRDKEKELEAIKAKFSTSVPATPPSPTNSNGNRKMRPPSATNLNLSSPWTQVSSSPKIKVIDSTDEEETFSASASAMQSLRLKEIEMEKRMERLKQMEEDMSRRLALASAASAASMKSAQLAQEKSELAAEAHEDNEDDDEDAEDDAEDEDEQEPKRRVVVISSPPASGRKSGRKAAGNKPPMVRL